MPTLRDIFDIAADALREGRDAREIFDEAGAAAKWFNVIGPADCRPRCQVLLAKYSVTTTTLSQEFVSRFIETGFVYAPYVPLIISEVVEIKPMEIPKSAIFHMKLMYESPEHKSYKLSSLPLPSTTKDEV